MPLTANLRASLLMASAMAGFTINDIFVKALTGSINAGQVMFVRGILMGALLGIFVLVTRRSLPLAKAFNLPMVLRVTGEIFGTLCFLFALFHMPIANVSAVLQALPLAVTAGAALFLGETVGIRRLTAIAVGFVGVIIIIRPGVEGFSVFSLSAVGTVLFSTVRDLATRRLPHDVPSSLVTLVTTVAVALVGALLTMPLGGWQPMTPFSFLMLTASAAFLFVGYQSIVLAMRIGKDVHIVAPFRYTSLLWSIVLGAAVYGEMPDGVTLVGAAVVVSTGLYTFYRERKAADDEAAVSATSAPPARGT